MLALKIARCAQFTLKTTNRQGLPGIHAKINHRSKTVKRHFWHIFRFLGYQNRSVSSKTNQTLYIYFLNSEVSP